MLLIKHLIFLSLSTHFIQINVCGSLMLKSNNDSASRPSFKILYKCVTTVVYKYFEGRTLMFFPNEVNDSFGEELLIYGINASVAIKKKNRLKSYEVYHKFYILLPNLSHGKKFKYYNSFVYKAEKSSLMLIIWKPNTPMEYISEVHNNFWKFRLIKVTSFMQEESGNVNVYSYFPFNKKSCGTGRIVQYVDKCTADGFQNNFNIFSGTWRLLDFQGCTLKSYVGVQYPDSYLEQLQDKSWNIKGSINYMLDTFKAHYNVSLSFHNLFNFKYNWYFYNISLDSILREHENESYEFGVGVFSMVNRNDNPWIDYMFGTDPECIAWAVPSFAGDRPSIWITLVSEFPLVIWCLTGIAIATGITFISVSKLIEDKQLSGIKVIRICLMMIFAITSESPKLKSRFKSVNMFLFKWCLWGLVIKCAYEASLGSLLTVSIPAQQLKSNKELLDRNFRVAGGVKMYEVLEEAATDKVLQILTKRFEILPPCDGNTMLEQITSRGNLAVLQPARYTRITSKLSKERHHLGSEVSVMKPCLVTTFSSPMIIRKGSFMSELLTAFSNRIFESGLTRYWKRKDALNKDVPSQKSTSLGLEKLQGVFVFYFTGIGIATFVLALEMIQHKYQIYKARK